MEIRVDERLPAGTAGDGFAATRWSLVAAARRGEAGVPLTELCVRYWYPVYAYVRRCGHEPGMAQRITLAFFHELVTARLAQNDPHQHGRFRAFILAEVNRFLAQGWHGQHVEQPAPGLAPPMPTDLLEARHQTDAPIAASPELAFQRGYALEVLNRALNRVRLEAQQAGRSAMFEALEPFLTREPAPGEYEAAGRELRTSPLALVIAVKRLRQRFRELVDEELSETVRDADALASERTQLHALLVSGAS